MARKPTGFNVNKLEKPELPASVKIVNNVRLFTKCKFYICPSKNKLFLRLKPSNLEIFYFNFRSRLSKSSGIRNDDQPNSRCDGSEFLCLWNFCKEVGNFQFNWVKKVWRDSKIFLELFNMFPPFPFLKTWYKNSKLQGDYNMICWKCIFTCLVIRYHYRLHGIYKR